MYGAVFALFRNFVLMFAQSAIETGGSQGTWYADSNLVFRHADKGPCEVFIGSCTTFHGNW
jgi:hypothetical protein